MGQVRLAHSHTRTQHTMYNTRTLTYTTHYLQHAHSHIQHTRKKTQTIRIDNIILLSPFHSIRSPKSSFTKRTGEQMTYQKYYSVMYNKTLINSEQPLLVHRHKRRGQPDEIIYLIPELCSMTGM